MCVRAVSISLYKKHAASIGCRRAAFPITLLGATELSLERHAFREARRELGRAVSFNQPDGCQDGRMCHTDVFAKAEAFLASGA